MEYGRVLVWLVAYAGLAALAAPATAALFSRFPRRGAGFALPVAMAVLGGVAYWVGRVRFGYVALLAGLAVLAAASGVALYRGVEVDRRGYAEAMGVFTVAFLFLVVIRALDPNVYPIGGEKFLDFGMLSSLMRAETLPPEDFWFAGEPVQYYYGGHMIASLLARLTVTPPRFAYNLALAGFYATAVTAAYALAGAIASHRGRSRRVAALSAGFFVAFASNLLTPVRLVVWAVPGLQGAIRGLDANARGIDDLVAPDVYPGTATYEAWRPGRFSYWDASRVIEGTVNEFPLFAYVNGDLHAHMMAMGFVLLVAAIGLAYWQTPAGAVWRRRAVVFGVLPPLCGLIAVVNTWSFPTVLGLAWLAVLFAPARPSTLLGLDRIVATVFEEGTLARADGGVATGTDAAVDDVTTATGTTRVTLREELVRIGSSLAVAGVLAALSVLFVVPFFTGSTGGRGVGFVGDRSSIWGLVLVHGAFLALAVRYLGWRAGSEVGNLRRATVLSGALVALGFLAGVVHVAPFALLLVVAWALLRSDCEVGYETALVVGALGVIVLVEFVYVTGYGTVSRFNTVFKTYSDVWLLWSVAGGAILAQYLDPGAVIGDGRVSARNVVSILFAVGLVTSLSAYGAFALAGHADHHLNDDAPTTLDSLEFVDRTHSTEAEAIRFVRELEGQPNLVTAPTQRMYHWSNDCVMSGACGGEPIGGSAPASLTGVPTVAGWAHEIGYRGETAWRTRLADVRRIYDGTPSEQARLLRAYDVEYVYVGPTERSRFENTDFASRLDGVTVAFESEYVTIYRVDQETLSAAPR